MISATNIEVRVWSASVPPPTARRRGSTTRPQSPRATLTQHARGIPLTSISRSIEASMPKPEYATDKAIRVFTTKLTKEGYFVKAMSGRDYSIQEIQAALSDTNLFGFGFSGHGANGYLATARSSSDVISPALGSLDFESHPVFRKPGRYSDGLHHRIGKLYLDACFSVGFPTVNNGWIGLTSADGEVYGNKGACEVPINWIGTQFVPCDSFEKLERIK